MGTRDARVDAYIAKMQPFAQDILQHIRDVVHAACPPCEEAMKWSMPFFTYKGALLCNMAGFKVHASFGFWLGKQVLGEDAEEGAMGQFGKLTSVKDLPSKTVLTKHVKKAMALVDSGATLKRGGDAENSRGTGKTASLKKTVSRKSSAAPRISVPPELAKALLRNPEAKAAFDAFSPSHRREYAEWIAEAKKPETKERRVQQALEMLAEGKGRNWKYETKKQSQRGRTNSTMRSRTMFV
jgi:uncharacterized protein YdeI (YjbR/CyaY-like superfamily)